jgi:hypothetical protein
MSNCHLVAGRSLIDLAASRLALRASARCARLLGPIDQRNGYRAVGTMFPTAVTVGPNDVVANHRIKCRDHLPHHCHDRDLRQFAGAFQTIVKEFERRIPIAGAHRGHVEHLADVCTTDPDTASALERAALEGVRRNTDQSSDRLRLTPPSSGKSATNVQTRTGPTPGIDVSSRYRCASVASVATISTKRFRGATANLKLTFHPDHSAGANHFPSHHPG